MADRFTPPLRFATVREVCVYTKLSKATIYALLNEQKIVAYKPLPRKTLIDLDSVDQYFATLPRWTPQGCAR